MEYNFIVEKNGDIKQRRGCGCYIGFTDMDNLGGVNEMILCGLRAYEYHEGLFQLCKKCKQKK